MPRLSRYLLLMRIGLLLLYSFGFVPLQTCGLFQDLHEQLKTALAAHTTEMDRLLRLDGSFVVLFSLIHYDLPSDYRCCLQLPVRS